MEECPILIKDYFSIKKEYEKLKGTITVSEQKVFYILYLKSRTNKSVIDLINLLEKTISEYDPVSGKELSEARKLIQLNFKSFLDRKALSVKKST